MAEGSQGEAPPAGNCDGERQLGNPPARHARMQAGRRGGRTQSQLFQDLPLGGVQAVSCHQARLHEQAVCSSSEAAQTKRVRKAGRRGVRLAHGWADDDGQVPYDVICLAGLQQNRPATRACTSCVLACRVAGLHGAGGQQQLAVGAAVVQRDFLPRAAGQQSRPGQQAPRSMACVASSQACTAISL